MVKDSIERVNESDIHRATIVILLMNRRLQKGLFIENNEKQILCISRAPTSENEK